MKNLIIDNYQYCSLLINSSRDKTDKPKLYPAWVYLLNYAQNIVPIFIKIRPFIACKTPHKHISFITNNI